MISKLRRSAVLASCVLLLGWAVPLTVGAETRVSAPTPPSNSTKYVPIHSPFALTISPTRLVLSPADIGRVAKLLVINRGEQAQTVTVEKENFVGGSDGSLRVVANAPYSASSWVTVTPTSFRIAPGTAQVVLASVTVAAHSEPGDHQVAIVFLVPAAKGPGNIKINRGIATPMYVAVGGRTSDTTLLSGFSAPGFAMGGPVTITATVRDVGTVHRDFRGRTDLALGASGSGTAFPDFTVLRGSIRDISTTWNPPLMCSCHISVSFTNADGSVQTSTVHVVVFPLYQLGIVLGVLLMVALGAIWRRHSRANARMPTHRRTSPVVGTDG
jgi:hypothetical protein